jgi:hypothetical protein
VIPNQVLVFFEIVRRFQRFANFVAIFPFCSRLLIKLTAEGRGGDFPRPAGSSLMYRNGTSRLLHVILTVLNLLIFRRTVYDGESNF